MVKKPTKFTDEIVKQNYEEIMQNGLPFLQVSPQIFQENNIAETFKLQKHREIKTLRLVP
mgnify:CR=1 FL=1